MIYPKSFECRIGFDKIRADIAELCISPIGASHCQKMAFSANLTTIREQLEQVNEFLSIIKEGSNFPLNHVFDLRTCLKSISTPGTSISIDNLFDLRRSLQTINEISSFFASGQNATEKYPRLYALAAQMDSFHEISRRIDTIIDKTGQILETASPLLHDLLRSQRSLTSSVGGLMKRILSRGIQSGFLASDTTPSIRDGRLVLPVAPANKRKIRGIVHDESATGKTIFIEPEEIVETNNKIRENEAEIDREIKRILAEVTEEIRPHADELAQTFNILGLFDFIRAKALFANDVDANMPVLQEAPYVEWYNATHPVLLKSLRKHNKQIVPLNITLNGKNRILVISGPNAGGKSVCLKTMGVVQYMMQCGLLPTVYSNSHMGIFKSLFIDIGDQQSIENDLSTYSSHLQNLKAILKFSDQQSLILIDEFGSGTEPQIGGAIAQAVLESVNQKKAFGVITTHYQNLKQLAENTDGLINGAMLYDRQHMAPLFQLSIGYPGSSFAVEIARKIGLPADVINKAIEIVGSDYVNLDKYLLDIVRDRKYWENKRADVHSKEKKLEALIESYNERVVKLKSEYNAIIKEAKLQAKEVIDVSNSQIEKTIKDIKESQAEKEKTKAVRQQLQDYKKSLTEQGNPSAKSELLDKFKVKPTRKQKATKKPDAPAQPKHTLEVGNNVVIKGTSTVGTIIEISGKSATVAFGSIKTKVALSKLDYTMRSAEKKQAPSISAETSKEIRQRQLNFKPEIDVRGMRGDEAIQAVTYFIDDAIQFNCKRVRILHGTGTGILKDLIRQYLNTVSGVESYRDEHIQLGGAGITVVNFK